MKSSSYVFENYIYFYQANLAFRRKYYELAIQLYSQAFCQYPNIRDMTLLNLRSLFIYKDGYVSESELNKILSKNKKITNDVKNYKNENLLIKDDIYLTNLEEEGFFIAHNNDPYFIVDMDYSTLNSGFYEISFKFFADINLSEQIGKIYLDYGKGFNEKDVISFPLVSGLNEKTIFLEKVILNLRFDPLESTTIFLLYDFEMKEVDKSYFVNNNLVNESQLLEGSLLNTDLEKSNTISDPFDNDKSRFIKNEYDVDKYAKIYSDLVRNGVNLEKHYNEKGYLEGRRLFYKDTHLKDMNSGKPITLIEYFHYKNSRGCAKTVVFTFNDSLNLQLTNPDIIDKNADYIYFGVPVDNGFDSVWEYKDSGFFIDEIDLLEGFHCLNLGVLFPGYDNIIWIESIEYLSSATFRNINMISGEGNKSIYVLGEKRLLDENISLSINHDLVFDVFVSNNIEKFEVIKPNCIVINDKGNIDLKLFSEWWRVLIKYQIANCIPLDIVLKLDGKYYPESINYKNKNFDTSEYLSKIEDYHLNIFGQRNLLQEKQKVVRDISVSIVVPVFNALDDVKLCLESIKTSTFDNYEVIIADDGSEEEVKNWLRAFEKLNSKFKLRIADVNRGYTCNVNDAIKNLNSDYIILLNSDTKVYGNWIEELIIPFTKDPSIGISGPLSNAGGWQTVPYLRGDNTLPKHLDLKKVNAFLQSDIYSEDFAISDIINGFCFCFSQEVKNTVGLFNEVEFPQGYGEEDDFCIRARRAGFKNIVVTSVYVHHSKSKSFGHEKRMKLATAGRKVLDHKYGEFGYKILTKSIGQNPLLNAKRIKLQNMFLPCKTEKTVIDEDVLLVPESTLLYPKTFNKNVCVHLHLHYVEMLGYFLFYLNKIPVIFDLYITTGIEEKPIAILDKLSNIKNIGTINIKQYENHGRDMFPFIDTMGKVFKKYDYFLHIHSKKSIHSSLGSKWLNQLMSHLLYSSDYILNILQLMDEENIGLMFPPVINELYPNYKWGKNKRLALATLRRMNIDISESECGEISFPAGNMFWGSTKAFKKLFELGLTSEDFPSEPIPVDGTLAHAIERMLSFISKDAGYNSAIVKPQNISLFHNEKKMFCNKMISIDTVYSSVMNKLTSGEGFSVVRFYDGEGAFYKAEYWSSSLIKERMTYYFGKGDYSKEDVLFLKKIILASLESTDIVGVPNLDIVDDIIDFTAVYADSRIENLPSIKRRYNESIDCNSAWRILSSFELAVNALYSEKIGFCTKDIHYDLLLSGNLYKILNKVSKVNIITSQPVRKYLEILFNLDVIEYKIPSRAIDASSMKGTNHYPNRFEELTKELASKSLNGELFLIGAGPLGKSYCDTVKKQGGVAIDLGAVFDSWINFLTRPEHSNSQSRFNSQLLLTSQNIIDLTNGEVVPAATIDTYDLPNQRKNKLLTHLFKD